MNFYFYIWNYFFYYLKYLSLKKNCYFYIIFILSLIKACNSISWFHYIINFFCTSHISFDLINFELYDKENCYLYFLYPEKYYIFKKDCYFIILFTFLKKILKFLDFHFYLS